MALPNSKFFITPEDYLAFEREAEERHEYWDGHIYAMAGESLNHSIICANISGEIHARLKGKRCHTLSPNMKIGASQSAKFFYPDLPVVCGEPVFHDQKRDVLINPKVIFEVLSPSTEARDRGRKFFAYQQIETLTDYLLIAQDEPRIDHYLRQSDGRWLMSSAIGLSATLHIESIDCTLNLSEVYDRVDFPSEEAEDETLSN